MDKPKRDAEGKIQRITKTCKVILVANDGGRYPAGEFTIKEPEPGPKLEQFAEAAWKAGRSSLSKLMPQCYRLIVLDGERQEAYGLERWVKLFDHQKEQERRLEGKGGKQTIRRGKLAA